MNQTNPIIVYSKSINASYNYFIVSIILVIAYTLLLKKMSPYLSNIFKYIIISILLYTVYLLILSSYKHISSLKKNIFQNKYTNLRNSILYNSIFCIFIIVLIYNFIYF